MLTKFLSSCDLGFSFQVCKIGMITNLTEARDYLFPWTNKALIWKLPEAHKAVLGLSSAFSFLTEP